MEPENFDWDAWYADLERKSRKAPPHDHDWQPLGHRGEEEFCLLCLATRKIPPDSLVKA